MMGILKILQWALAVVHVILVVRLVKILLKIVNLVQFRIIGFWLITHIIAYKITMKLIRPYV